MKSPFINQRGFVFAFIVGLVFLVCVVTSNAGIQKLAKPQGYIEDSAEVLDQATKTRLETVLKNFRQRTGIYFVIVVVPTAEQEALYDYSLRLANDWNIGSMTSPNKSMLMLVAVDKRKFFTQVSRTARNSLPDGLIGEMGLRMHPNLEIGAFGPALLTGLQAFTNGVGETRNFTFADLDTDAGQTVAAQRQRPRVVGTPTPLETPTSTPVAQPTETPAMQPTPTATREGVRTPSATPVVEKPQSTPSPAAAETPAASVATPTATPEATQSAVASATPVATDTRKPQPSPSLVAENRDNTAKPTKSPSAIGKPSVAPTPDPEDEKEEVELTLTKPVEQRIDILKAFIAAHPQSVAVPRANELIVASHATIGDKKLQAGDTAAGLQEFRLAISEAPSDMSDRLFTEVIARIPMNLFLRGQRAAATEAAHQAEALAKLNPTRLLALTEFYMAVEDAGEANRIAELAAQNAPDSAAAHQALGAARHIGLRLDDAESEYARALALDPKSKTARIALADLKRAGGKFDEALALYREQLTTDAGNKSARAGLVLSLLELGKKDEADQELNKALADKEQSRNLSLLVGTAYWFTAHNDAKRGLDLAQKAVAIEPRYSWAQIALSRALVANDQPLEAERALRFARQYSRFPTLDYELASVLVSVGLFDEAAQELQRSFSLKDGQIETRLAGRTSAKSSSFIELLAPERRAAIFQPVVADTEANAKTIKGLLTFTTAMNSASLNDDDALASAQSFTAGDDAMRTYRLLYVAGKFVRKNVALASVGDLMDKATEGVEAALGVSAATVAVQPEELSDIRARALAQGGTPDIPTAPRNALSGILRGRIEDLAGLALFNLEKYEDAVTRFRRAVSVTPEGTPLARSTMWHLGSALEASGKTDQALLYYIKSYVTGPPDAARRAIIEKVYKKVNGTLEGLEDKIGPAGSATATPTP